MPALVRDPSSAAQQPTQAPPVFRAGTVIVPLTVTVLDKKKQPVTDLTQGDFTVFENGVRQEIRSFFPQNLKPQTPSSDRPTLIRGAHAADIAPQTRRTFLFVMGYGRLDIPTKAIDATIRFIRESLLPQDLVAVMAFNRVTDLTTDHEQAAHVVERYKRGHEAVIRAIVDFYGAGNLGVDLPPRIQAQIDALFQPPTTAPDHVRPRSALTLVLASPELKLSYYSVPNMELDGDPHLRWNHRFVINDTPKVYAGIEFLRLVDGEKHLIWFTNRGLIGTKNGLHPRPWSVQDDERMATTAGNLRIVMDIVHTAGAQRGIHFEINAAQRVAELTGGQFTGVEYAETALGWIDRATRFNYLLGYTPSNATLGDRRRTVSVKVNRPGVTVLFRHGYSDEADETPAEAERRLAGTRIRSVAKSGEDNEDIKVDVQAVVAPSAREVLVNVTIDASRLSFVRTGERRAATVNLEIYCGSAKEKVVGESTRKIELNVDEEEYQRLLRTGLRYSIRVPVSDPPKYVKVFVYDFGADLIGTALVTFKNGYVGYDGYDRYDRVRGTN